MLHQFRGHVREVEGDLCWMEMRDLTAPSNPDEQWTVEIAKLPKRPEVGEFVTLTITDDGGTFQFDEPKYWTAEELERVRQRAREISEWLGINSATHKEPV